MSPSHTQNLPHAFLRRALQDCRHVIPVRLDPLGRKVDQHISAVVAIQKLQVRQERAKQRCAVRIDWLAKSGGELTAGASSSTASDPSPVAGRYCPRDRERRRAPTSCGDRRSGSRRLGRARRRGSRAPGRGRPDIRPTGRTRARATRAASRARTTLAGRAAAMPFRHVATLAAGRRATLPARRRASTSGSTSAASRRPACRSRRPRVSSMIRSNKRAEAETAIQMDAAPGASRTGIHSR